MRILKTGDPCPFCGQPIQMTNPDGDSRVLLAPGTEASGKPGTAASRSGGCAKDSAASAAPKPAAASAQWGPRRKPAERLRWGEEEGMERAESPPPGGDGAERNFFRRGSRGAVGRAGRACVFVAGAKLGGRGMDIGIRWADAGGSGRQEGGYLRCLKKANPDSAPVFIATNAGTATAVSTVI